MNIRLIKNAGLTLILGSLTLSACQNFFTFSSSSCDGVTVTDYSVKNIRLNLLDHSKSHMLITQPSLYEGNINEVSFNFTIDYDSHTREIAQNHFNFSLIANANACGYPIPEFPVNQIKSINISSNEIQNGALNLNSQFKIESIADQTFVTDENAQDVNEFNNANQGIYTDYINNFKLLANLENVDNSISTMSFTFSIEMEDGSVYEVISEQINVAF